MAASTETLTFSNLYPNRPIRPLPKRRLRERLSPEAAESIRYPPSTRPTSIFYPPYPTDIPDEEYRRNEPPPAEEAHDESGDEVRQFVGAGSGSRNGAYPEGVEDNREPRNAVAPRPQPEVLNTFSSPRQSSKTDQSRHSSSMLPPTDLSADGYESFENTNNKKKRKIPTAGDSSLGGSHSMSDGSTIPVSTGLPGTHLQGDGIGNAQYPPLNGSSTNNKAETPVRGIISSAIAKAGKDSTQQGQENISLLQHSAINRSSPASAQFTFTCESQVPGTYRGDLASGHAPPGYIPANMKQPAMVHGLNTMNGQGPGHRDVSPTGASHGSVGRRRKNRKSINRDLNEQARQRRAKTRENRRRNPTPPEDEWVCDFCIYESIWGEPPVALIRSYEERERRERIAEMNKKRRLEQVKARSRKGKKPAKNPGGKSGNGTKPHHDGPEHDTHAAVHEDVGSELDDVTSEEYADESFHPLDEVDDGELSPIRHDINNHARDGNRGRGGVGDDDGAGGVGRRGDEIQGPPK
ncbi:uncharacterized protein DNG_02682 [Cephalotrichum gorgonifer]|uniref:Uncharacterized protein n=1 Tax=Cephalotrichum gorgonifer TaxID=2041049 RepID=A0AAE8MVH7_9PEZI|nr:uncharacterized protein DNG_02682 [Cephalotrichum gorgonifer]